MKELLHLQVVTAAETVYDAMVSYLEIPLENGSIGVLYNHAPLIGAVVEGVLKAKGENGVEYLAVSQGVVNIAKNEVILLTRTAELAENIDVARAVASEKRARERLVDHASGWDMNRAEISLHRAIARQTAARLSGR